MVWCSTPRTSGVPRRSHRTKWCGSVCLALKERFYDPRHTVDASLSPLSLSASFSLCISLSASRPTIYLKVNDMSRCLQIKGWTLAMQMMREGDVWELVIPSELAYGNAHRGKHIAPGSV